MKLRRIPYIICCFIILVGCQENDQLESQVETAFVEEEYTLPMLPKQVEFCGSLIPIDNFDVRERLDKELIVNTFYHSSTIQSFKRANRYFERISTVLKEEGVPDDFKYLCLIESGLTQATSPSGAKGFWQFMPETGKEFALQINGEVDERMHLEKSTKAACRYLKSAYAKFDDWVLCAASYNRGIGAIEHALDEQGVNNYFDLHLTNETSRYVFRILALKTIFENPESYGFHPDKMELYPAIETRNIVVNETISNLKEWALQHGSNYRMLKLLNPWLLSNKLTVKQGSYIIELPVSE